MADSYRQTSLVIPRLTEREEAWLKSEYERRKESAYSEDNSLYPVADRFEFMDDNAPKGWKRHLWIAGEEWVHIEAVASLLQAFLAKFRPHEALGFQYSDTCSKPHVDEFSGGAVFVTAKSVRYFHADSWLDKQFAAHKKKSAASAHKKKSAASRSNTGR